MNKLNYLFALAAVLLGINVGRAQTTETVNNYSVDFNTSISTSAHDFKVASGWGHVVDSYFDDEEYETDYVTYTYSSNSGVDGSGALKIGTQSLGSGWETHDVIDLLVTPKITGTSSIFVKKASYSGKISFYTVTKSGTTYSRGSQISVTIPELSQDSYVKVDIPSQNGAYIGIKGDNVYIDNFSAESAEIEKTKALAFSSSYSDIENVNGTTPDCDADGNFKIRFGIHNLQNKGDIDLNPGDENYSISILYDGENGTVINTTPIPFKLAAGETANETMYVEATVPYANHAARKSYYLKENITGTTQIGAWIQPTAYAPVLRVGDDNTNDIESGTAVAFGMINNATTKEYTISNNGAAPLNVTSVTVPDGFSVDKTSFTVDAHQKSTLTVTALAEKPGIYSGNLTIKSQGLDDFTLALSATVLDPSKYYITFEDGKQPSGMIFGENWSVAEFTSDNKYVAESSLDDDTKLITPLLKVTTGEKFSFDAGRTSSTGRDSHLNVYYSTDRTNWTLARKIATSELSSDRAQSWGSVYESKPTNFVIDNIPAGNYYIAFEAGYAYVDNIYGYELVPVDHDILITKSDVPTTATVNNAYTATATLKNNNSKAEADYTAKLYVDGKKVASVEPTEIAAGETKDFTFTYTPNAAGTFEAYIEFKAGDVTASTEPVSLTIEGETASEEVSLIEKADGTSASYVIPITAYYCYSQSETLYPKDFVSKSGLKAGDKISKITFKGNNTAGEATGDLVLKISNTEDKELTSSASLADGNDMTQIYNGSYTVRKAGTYNSNEPLIEITLSTPFEYTGNGLKLLATYALPSSSDDVRANFEYYKINNNDVYVYGAKSDQAEPDSWSSQSYAAVPYFTIAKEPNTISGTITSGNEAVTNATVTLKSGDVVYSGNTDEEGKYDIPVIQTDKDYTLTVVADGYEDYTETDPVSFTSGNVTKDIQLTAADITVTITDAGWASFSSTKSVAVPTGVTAYIVTSEDGTTAKLETVNAIPANTGVLLQGEAGEYTFAPSNAEAVTGNILGNTASGDLTIGNSEYGKVYAFGSLDGEVGFVKASKNYTIARGKAYLNVSSAEAKSFIDFDGVVNAIRNVNVANGNVLDDSKPMYNLQGMRVSKSFKGVVIQNGKKFIRK